MAWHRTLGCCSKRVSQCVHSRYDRRRGPALLAGIILLLTVCSLVGCGARSTSSATAEPSPPILQTQPTLTSAPSTATADQGQRAQTTVDAPEIIGRALLSDIPSPGLSPSAMTLLENRVYVANRRSDNVSIIERGRVASVVSVGREPASISAHVPSGRVFVANERDATISVLEDSCVVDTWDEPGVPTALAVVGDQLWVGTDAQARINIRSVDEGMLLAHIDLSADLGVISIVTSHDGALVMATTFGRLHVIDVSRLSEIRAVDCGCYQTIAVAPNGDTIYVTEYDNEAGHAYLLALDVDTLEVTDRVPVPSDPASLAVEIQSGRLFVALSTANQVICLDQSLRTIATVRLGPSPRHVALDAEAGLLYVASAEGDSISLIDTDELTHVDTIPLATHLEAMAWDAAARTLYIAEGSADRVVALDATGNETAWFVGGYPSNVLSLEEEGVVAVLCSASAQLRVYSPNGELLRTYPTGPRPRGLYFDSETRILYGGDLAVDMETGRSRSIMVEGLYGAPVPPIQVIADTRRKLTYGVAFNGIPGSNGGQIVYPLNQGNAQASPAVPGRLSVIDVLYDEDVDRFFATNARMGTFGLQVWSPETLSEVLYLSLPAYPSSMILNPTTHHLWLALTSAQPGSTSDRKTLLLCLDTRSLGLAATLEIDGQVESLAASPELNRIYAACGDIGTVFTVGDVAVQAPPAPTVTPTWTPYPTSTPTVAPPPTPTTQPSPPPTPCSYSVDEQILAVWTRLGGRQGLGCPSAAAVASEMAHQTFEHGEMLWRAADQMILVLAEDGTYSMVEDTWREEMPSVSCSASAPPDRYQPVRGFGRVWCENPAVQSVLGWAVGEEQPLSGVYQAFEGGQVIITDGLWRVLGADGHWYGSP